MDTIFTIFAPDNAMSDSDQRARSPARMLNESVSENQSGEEEEGFVSEDEGFGAGAAAAAARGPPPPRPRVPSATACGDLHTRSLRAAGRRSALEERARRDTRCPRRVRIVE